MRRHAPPPRRAIKEQAKFTRVCARPATAPLRPDGEPHRFLFRAAPRRAPTRRFFPAEQVAAKLRFASQIEALSTVIASDSEAIQAKQPPQSLSLDRFALLAMTTETFRLEGVTL
jgi:hypothetical protein